MRGFLGCFPFVSFSFVCFLLIGAYSGATFDAGRSLLTTMEVSAGFHFPRVSEGEALALCFFFFFFFKRAYLFPALQEESKCS